MKSLFLTFLLFLIISFNSHAQFTKAWTSGGISANAVSGFMKFDKQADNSYLYRLYAIDSNKIQIMGQGYSSTPAYTYNFNAAEKLAGGQVYSLGIDLTGDGKPELYILAYNGTATSYIQSFKILDIVNNVVVFEANSSSYYYSYPSFVDLNADGKLEMTFAKSDVPYTNLYYYDVYTTGVTSVGNESNLPVKFKLEQNYPNPFNPSTTIDYSVSSPTNVKINIYNLTGEIVKELVNGNKTAGAYSAVWDGRDNSGMSVPTGIYFYRMESSNGENISRKMIILK